MGNEVLIHLVIILINRLHTAPYQEVILRKKENEENASLVKIKAVQCGGHMVDALSEDGILYTWGDARKQPFGLPNHHVVSATEIKSLSSLGKTYAYVFMIILDCIDLLQDKLWS